MTRNILLSFLAIFLAGIGMAQEDVQTPVFQFERDPDIGFSPKESYIIYNENNGDIAVFLEYDKLMEIHLYDRAFQKKAAFTSPGLPRRFEDIVGYQITETEYRIFSRADDKLGSLVFNISDRTTTEKKIDFSFERREELLHSFTNNGVFYLFTVNKKTNELFLLRYTGGEDFERNQINIPEMQFTDIDGDEIDLYDLVVVNSFFGAKGLSAVDNNSVINVNAASPRSKLYIQDNILTLALDREYTVTYLIDISFDDFNAKISTIEKPKLPEEPYGSNSFLFDDHIYQLVVSKETMVIEVKERESKKVLKTFNATKDQPIAFKNTDFIMEGGAFSEQRTKVLEETDDFLRKISRGDVGIAVNKVAGTLQLSVGALMETFQIGIGGGAYGGGFGGGSPVVPMAQMNTANNVFQSFHESKTLRIECLLDTSFNHLSGKPPKNVFEKMLSITEDNKYAKNETTTRVEEGFLHGYYDYREKKYIVHYIPSS